MQLQAESTGKDAAEQFKPNVVQLTVESADKTPLSGGCGFVVGEENGYLYVVTAKHVVCADQPVETKVFAQFYGKRGEDFAAKVLNISVEDLAVMKIRKPFEDYTWKRQCYSRPKKDDSIWFVGRSQDWYVPFEPGYAFDLLPGKFSVAGLDVLLGSSGAPLISEKGIVGMVLEDEPGRVVTALNMETIRAIVEKRWKRPWGLEECIPAPKVPIFTIEPTEVVVGMDKNIRLTWVVEGADTVTIEPGIGTVDAVAGSREAQAPTKDTVYTLVAENKGGKTEETRRVTVIPPKITGKIYYDEEVITTYSNAPVILTKFYRPESLEDIPVEFHYNDQTGEFVFKHVLPGKYRVCIYIDSGYPFASHSPGDFYGCVDGLNDDIVVPPGVTEVTWNYRVVHRIHLLQPVDNQELRTSVGEPPETLYGSGFLPFVWKPVPEASYYKIRLLLKDGDTDEEVESRSETVTATCYSPNLNVTSENEYYMFSVAAYNAQHELVGDFSNFYRNGTDGWFEFKLVSKPD